MRYGAVGCGYLTATAGRTAATSPDQRPCGAMWCGAVVLGSAAGRGGLLVASSHPGSCIPAGGESDRLPNSGDLPEFPPYSPAPAPGRPALQMASASLGAPRPGPRAAPRARRPAPAAPRHCCRPRPGGAGPAPEARRGVARVVRHLHTWTSGAASFHGKPLWHKGKREPTTNYGRRPTAPAGKERSHVGHHADRGAEPSRTPRL